MDIKLYTVEEVEKFLTVSYQTVYRAVQNGDLECNRFGTAMRISNEQLQTYVELLGQRAKDKAAANREAALSEAAAA